MIKYTDGVRRWNGVGGWVEEGESLEEGLLREFKEEVGLEIEKEKLKKVLSLDRKDPKYDWQLNVFLLPVFNETPDLVDPTLKEFKWFDFDEIPYEKMWEDNKDWLPELLQNS